MPAGKDVLNDHRRWDVINYARKGRPGQHCPNVCGSEKSGTGSESSLGGLFLLDAVLARPRSSPVSMPSRRWYCGANWSSSSRDVARSVRALQGTEVPASLARRLRASTLLLQAGLRADSASQARTWRGGSDVRYDRAPDQGETGHARPSVVDGVGAWYPRRLHLAVDSRSRGRRVRPTPQRR